MSQRSKLLAVIGICFTKLVVGAQLVINWTRPYTEQNAFSFLEEGDTITFTSPGDATDFQPDTYNVWTTTDKAAFDDCDFTDMTELCSNSNLAGCTFTWPPGINGATHYFTCKAESRRHCLQLYQQKISATGISAAPTPAPTFPPTQPPTSSDAPSAPSTPLGKRSLLEPWREISSIIELGKRTVLLP